MEDFNPRSPWGERHVPFWVSSATRLFQSTLPVGGATCSKRSTGRRIVISIHAPRGGSDFFGEWHCGKHWYFNPRSPWGERLKRNTFSVVVDTFQSTLPVGGAT